MLIGFKNVRQKRPALAPSGFVLFWRQANPLPQALAFGDRGQSLEIDERGLSFGQLPFRFRGVLEEKVFRDDQSQD